MLTNEKSKKEPIASTEDVRNYWKKENIPQQWYTSKEPLSLAYFNDIAKERYEKYYPYLKEKAEFQYHAYESVLEIGVGLGTDLIQFAINKSLVYGIDLGKDQIEITKQHFIKKNCNFEITDSEIFYFIIIFLILININIIKKLIVMPFL